ncbi:MAG: fused MFS/spermidine synthase [Myxococcota bacterium]
MWALWIAFFVSGVAGLSYELTWVRYLTHVFGATTPAIAATIAVFFAGLALGSWAGARWFARRERPALAYAGLEAAIGVVGMALPFVFDGLDAVLSAREGTQSIGELLVASTLVLLLPTALLGATFPAMVAVTRRFLGAQRATALPYGLNTLGAVVGCLLVSLWWLPSLGLRGTSFTLASCDLAVAVVVAVVYRARTSVPEPPATRTETTTAEAAGLPANRAAVLAVVSGFIAIAIEIHWVRALALSFPATVYVFALVLSAYLVGIGLGSAAVDRWLARHSPTGRDLLAAYVAAGLGCVLALNLMPEIGPWSLTMLAGGSIDSWNAYLAWIGGIGMLTMLPATLAMGAALPLLVGLASGPQQAVATTAGRIYGLNTLGGVFGSLAGTFWMMPVIGLSRSAMLLALGYVALAVLVPVDDSLRSARRGLIALVGMGVLVTAIDLQPELNALRHRPDTELLHYRDSPSATVAIYEDEQGVRALRIDNQYTLSNTAPATVAMQYRLGLVPTALHPAPRRALLIGFATGTTLAAMAVHPGVEQLDCVELHDEVFELASFFAEANHQVWQHPRVDLIEGDGRRYLARPGPRYDLIVADLFVPRNPGVGALYSLDHFEAVKQRLAPDGVFVVWLPLWQLGQRELGSIARSMLEVFPEAEAWVTDHGEQRPILGLVVGATASSVSVDPRPLRPDARGLEHARRVMDTAALQTLAHDAPENRLDRPFVEFSAPRSMMEAKIEGRSLLSQTLEHLPPL